MAEETSSAASTTEPSAGKEAAAEEQTPRVDFGDPLYYDLDICTIINNEGWGMDIRNLMGECTIYESIFNNFITGEMVIDDSINMYDKLMFTGQETLRIKFGHRLGGEPCEENAKIDKFFRIHKVSDVQRTDQGTLMYKISFATPEFIASRRERVSQAFRGNPIEIATKIGTDRLKIEAIPKAASGMIRETNYKEVPEIAVPYWEYTSINEKPSYTHVVIPNWSINYTMNWLCRQAQDKVLEEDPLGGKYFWYETATGGYRINSINDMLTLDYLPNEEFHYSPAADLDREKEDESPMTLKLISYTAPDQADVIEASVKGMFAGRQITVDLTGKSFHDIYKAFDNRKDPRQWFIRSEPETYSVGQAVDFDENGKPSSPIEKPLDPLETIYDYADSYLTVHHILQRGGGVHSDSYETVHSDNWYGTELASAAAMKLAEYNTISGLISARTDICVGERINLRIPTSDTGTVSKDLPEPDPFNDGHHLITHIRWTLGQGNELRTNIKCIKQDILENCGKELSIKEYVNSVNELADEPVTEEEV